MKGYNIIKKLEISNMEALKECVSDKSINNIIIKNINQLTHFTIADESVTNDQVASLLKHSNCLEFLDFKNAKNINDGVLTQLNVKNLKALRLSAVLNEKNLAAMLEKSNCLECLDLLGTNITGEVLKKLNLKKIKALTLSGVNLNEESVSTALEKINALEILIIEKANITGSCLSKVEPSKLVTLYLGGCNNLTDCNLNCLLSRAKRLRKLRIAYTKVSNLAFKGVKLKNLTELDCRRCYNIRDEFFNNFSILRILQNCPKLAEKSDSVKYVWPDDLQMGVGYFIYLPLHLKLHVTGKALWNHGFFYG